MDEIINALGEIRNMLSSSPASREIALAITKVDEAMLWIGVEATKPREDDNGRED